jgi:MFS family permease
VAATHPRPVSRSSSRYSKVCEIGQKCANDRPATATRVLLLSGWLAGAESASWALLQPVVARLDDTPQIRMQQGMLRTFGRVMPILLPLTSVLIVAAVLIGFTLTVNVPIHKRTLTWDAEHPPEGWRADRHRWHAYQGVRAVLLAVWFLCAVGAVTLD